MKLNKQKCICLSSLILAVLFFLYLVPGFADEESLKTYVGSETCGECHESEFESFMANAKKANSYKSIQIMQKGLTETEKKECYSCHTTGYGANGGFVSEKETPHLKNAGCEVCHGPGSLHAESEDPEDIITELSMENCVACHNSERVANFNFKPLLYGGAH